MEPVIPLSIVLGVAGGGLSALLTLGRKFEAVDLKHNAHIQKVDARMDAIELKLAKDYVDKSDLTLILERLDDRIDRMDNKLDQILFGYNKSASSN